MSNSNSNDSMLEMFLFEMSSLLDRLDEILLASEKNQSLTQDDVNEIFRIMHTIKGSSAMMDFTVISTVTHRLEDTFYLIREKGISSEHFTPLFDVMLDAVDFLKSQLEAIQNGEALAEGNDELVRRTIELIGWLNGEAPPAPAQPAEPAPPAEDAGDAAPSSPPAEETPPVPPTEAPPAPPVAGTAATPYHIEVWFDEDCGMENLRAFMLVNTLKANCTVHAFEPGDIESNPESASQILMHGFSIHLETELDQDDLQEIIEQAMHVKTAVITPVDAASASSGAPISGDRYDVFIRFEDDCGMENLRAFMLLNSLRAKCKIISHIPDDIESSQETSAVIMQNGFKIVLETPQSQMELQGFLEAAMHVKTAKVVPIESESAPASAPASVPAPAASDASKPAPAAQPATPAASDAPKPAPAAAPPAASAKPAEIEAPKNGHAPATNKAIKQNIINVSLSKLDELMDIMGELVITESMVTRSPDLKGLPKLDNFHKAARQLRKLTDELQDMVMSIRMVPVAATFQKMQRIVRDMCRALGKNADLLTMGEETDIDKTIIDNIADPIMHLVRNAMDHGIETPEDRRAAGKSERATITLSAQNTGGEILITISDDGKGLDAEKLLSKAKANGILTKPASEYTEKEAFMLLCAPGFSMKEVVTEYSGRGVGMDVVKKNIEKVGGTVVIESKKGQGMNVFLKIPLTLAIVDGMDISVGGGVYTLQITAINESFKASQEQVITDTYGNEMIMIRGNVYPIIRLYDLFAVPNAITNIEEGILIWVQSGEQSACLFVDQLIGEQQIVVKPLPKYLHRYNIKSYGISGCTILGDGNISLILDVGGIIEKVMEKR